MRGDAVPEAAYIQADETTAYLFEVANRTIRENFERVPLAAFHQARFLTRSGASACEQMEMLTNAILTCTASGPPPGVGRWHYDVKSCEALQAANEEDARGAFSGCLATFQDVTLLKMEAYKLSHLFIPLSDFYGALSATYAYGGSVSQQLVNLIQQLRNLDRPSTHDSRVEAARQFPPWHQVVGTSHLLWAIVETHRAAMEHQESAYRHFAALLPAVEKQCDDLLRAKVLDTRQACHFAKANGCSNQQLAQMILIETTLQDCFGGTGSQR